MNKYLKIFFSVAVFAVILFGTTVNSYAAKPSDYGLKEGDLISAVFSDDPDVYIINNQGYKRLFLNPEIFEFYGHLGGFFNVKLVPTEVRDAFVTSGLFRNCEDNDSKVFGVDVEGEDSGKLHWVNVSAASALSEDPNFFDKVFCVNRKEFSWYPKGPEFKKVKDVPAYERLKEMIKIATNVRIKEYKDKDDVEKNVKNIGKVIICHVTGAEFRTIEIAPVALKAHLAHGDEVGKCKDKSGDDEDKDQDKDNNEDGDDEDEDSGSTPDTIAPLISGLTAGNITDVSAHITWTTNELSNSKAWYGAASPAVATSSTSMVSFAEFSLEHDLALSGLLASTTYYYFIESLDKAGNMATSANQSFTTLTAVADTASPIISDISATHIGADSVKIVWTTDEASDSRVWYSFTTPVSPGDTTPTVSNSDLVSSHRIVLSAGLSPSITYHYLVVSKDASGNTSTSDEYTFSTTTAQ